MRKKSSKMKRLQLILKKTKDRSTMIRMAIVAYRENE